MISDVDFQFVRDLLKTRAAIIVESDKKYLVEARVAHILTKRNLATMDEFIALVRKSPNNDIERDLINVMTTNETSFFRDAHPFEALKKKILPELINNNSGTLDIWCAASSSGQEPYTIAMLIKENFPFTQCKIKILATDLCTEVLNKAQAGFYTQFEVNRGLPVSYLVKYFDKSGSVWRVKEEIRKMIEFREFNLCTDWPAMPSMDIIFLRNVMIYFEMDTKIKILQGMYKLLKPSGVMFLGGAETTINTGVPFLRQEAQGSCYYIPIK